MHTSSVPRIVGKSAWVAAFALLWVVAAPDPADAQVDRNQLGKRLRRMELAWQQTDAATRARATPALQAAVRSFFSLQFRAAASQLDDAYFVVRGKGGAAAPTDWEKWTIAQRLDVTPLVMDVTTTEVRVELKPHYQTKAAAPATAKLQLRLLDGTNQAVAERTCTLDEASQGLLWNLATVPAGDYSLAAHIESGENDGGANGGADGKAAAKIVALLPVGISRAERLTERLGKIEAELKRWKESPDPLKFRGIREGDGAGLPRREGQELRDTLETARATVTSMQAILQALVAGKVQETDYPAHRWLTTCEELLAIPDHHEQRVAREARVQDVWLTLVEKNGQAEVRMRAPYESVRRGPLPVLLLFHGAGGSENMFFETYGAGRAVELALERGWLVVAVRQGLFGPGLDTDALVRALGRYYEIDKGRVFLMGHSMGAGQVARQVSRHPELAAAAVALGGGGSITKSEGGKQPIWFVAAGELDFGRSGAAILKRRLQENDAQVTYREYPDVEHLAIVQAALDDVFKFLDDAVPAK